MQKSFFRHTLDTKSFPSPKSQTLFLLHSLFCFFIFLLLNKCLSTFKGSYTIRISLRTTLTF